MKTSKKEMRLLITYDFPPQIGGIQNYLYNIVKNSYNENDQVYFIGIGAKTTSYPELRATVKYITPHFFFINRKLSLVFLIIPYIFICWRQRGKLAVDCGNVNAAVIPWFLKPFTRQPYSIYTYGSELISLRKKTFLNKLRLRALTDAKSFITLGKYTGSLIHRIVFKPMIQIVPPRISLPEYHPKVTKPKKAICSVLCVGRLVPHKGQANLIRAASIIAKTSSQYRFLIVGDGPLYIPLEKMRYQYNVEQIVTINNCLSEKLLQIEYEQAAIFALPSLETTTGTEGFGIVLLEAMAYHLPIIASNAGGIPEVLDYGNCGMLIAPGNATKLAQAIQFINNNDTYAQQLTRKAHKRLMNNYVWK